MVPIWSWINREDEIKKWYRSSSGCSQGRICWLKCLWFWRSMSFRKMTYEVKWMLLSLPLLSLFLYLCSWIYSSPNVLIFTYVCRMRFRSFRVVSTWSLINRILKNGSQCIATRWTKELCLEIVIESRWWCTLYLSHLTFVSKKGCVVSCEIQSATAQHESSLNLFWLTTAGNCTLCGISCCTLLHFSRGSVTLYNAW